MHETKVYAAAAALEVVALWSERRRTRERSLFKLPLRFNTSDFNSLPQAKIVQDPVLLTIYYAGIILLVLIKILILPPKRLNPQFKGS